MGDEDDLLTAAQKNDLAKAQAILDRNPSLLRMHTPNGTLVLTATFYGAGDVVKLLLARTPEDALNLYEAATVGNARRLKTILGQSRVRGNEATKDEGFDPLGLAAIADPRRARGAKGWSSPRDRMKSPMRLEKHPPMSFEVFGPV